MSRRSCFNLAQRPRNAIRTGEENEGLGDRRHGVSTPHPDSSQSLAYVAKKSFIVIEPPLYAPDSSFGCKFCCRQIGNKGELNVFLFSCIAYIACDLPYSPIIFGNGTSKESFRLTPKRVSYSLRLR